MDFTIIAALLSPSEPDPPSPTVCAVRTLMRMNAAAQGVTFAQMQAGFRAMWNATYPANQIPNS